MGEDSETGFPRRSVELGQNGTAARVVEGFRSRYGREPEMLVRSPGRVALLGSHVDYSDGWVMPAAIDRAVWLAVAVRGKGGASGLSSLDFDDEVRLDLMAPPPPLDQRSDSTLAWTDYPAALAWAWSERGWPLPAIEAAYGSDLPVAAGVSSSAAVEMAFFAAFRALVFGGGTPFGEDPPGGIAGAQLGRRAENGYLGVQSGIMDQFACLHGRAGHVLFLDCRTLEHDAIPVPEAVEAVVFDSGVRRRLAESGFNDRRAESRQALELLRPALPSARALRDVSPADLDAHGHLLPARLLRRARHTVGECARVRRAAEDLRSGDLRAFGEAMGASHASSRDLYEVSIPELDFLSEMASSMAGCFGAKLMGGGFGGCAAALVRADAAEEIGEAVSERFASRFGRRPSWFRTPLADGTQLCDWSP